MHVLRLWEFPCFFLAMACRYLVFPQKNWINPFSQRSLFGDHTAVKKPKWPWARDFVFLMSIIGAFQWLFSDGDWAFKWGNKNIVCKNLATGWPNVSNTLRATINVARCWNEMLSAFGVYLCVSCDMSSKESHDGCWLNYSTVFKYSKRVWLPCLRLILKNLWSPYVQSTLPFSSVLYRFFQLHCVCWLPWFGILMKLQGPTAR